MKIDILKDPVKCRHYQKYTKILKVKNIKFLMKMNFSFKFHQQKLKPERIKKHILVLFVAHLSTDHDIHILKLIGHIFE